MFLRVFRRTVSAVLLMVSFSRANAADVVVHGQVPPGQEFRSEMVPIADLNLTTESGQAELNGVIGSRSDERLFARSLTTSTFDGLTTRRLREPPGAGADHSGQ